MGTGNSRRRSDRVTIRPQGKKTGSGTPGDGGSLKCPLSFQVALRSEHSDLLGGRLFLRQEGGAIGVYHARIKLTELGEKRSQLIGRCMQSGFHYVGIVKRTRSGQIYGEFVRTP